MTLSMLKTFKTIDRIDVILAIPEPAELRRLLHNVGGETVPAQLGIDSDLVNRSLSEAHHLRNRFTLIKFLNEIVKEEHNLDSEELNEIVKEKI